MAKIKSAVLGATGIVGQHFVKLLVDHPYFELAAVCASDARAGQRLREIKPLIADGIPPAFADMVFDPMSIDLLLTKGIEIVFSALPADIATGIEKEAAEKGLKVFSNANSYRMNPQVPILIPEINYQHLALAQVQQQQTKGFIITNANCTTTGLALALIPLLLLRIKKLIVASYQAISGAGYPGVAALDIAGNVIPFIQGEENKVRQECAKICGRLKGSEIVPTDWEVHAHCFRVPTIVGHLISVHVEVEQDVDFQGVVDRFKSYVSPEQVMGLPTAPVQPVILNLEPTRPQPRIDVDAGEPVRAKGMTATVGRLEVSGRIIRFATLSNNLVRGAAGGSVLNAELAYRERLL